MIITIITSMRFKEELLEQTKKLSLEGHIVLSPVICSEFEGNEHHGELMQLHRKKLKMCDRAFVLNVDGYIGEDGQAEIDFCFTNRIPVYYLRTWDDKFKDVARILCSECNGLRKEEVSCWANCPEDLHTGDKIQKLSCMVCSNLHKDVNCWPGCCGTNPIFEMVVDKSYMVSPADKDAVLKPIGSIFDGDSKIVENNSKFMYAATPWDPYVDHFVPMSEEKEDMINKARLELEETMAKKMESFPPIKKLLEELDKENIKNE